MCFDKLSMKCTQMSVIRGRRDHRVHMSNPILYHDPFHHKLKQLLAFLECE